MIDSPYAMMPATIATAAISHLKRHSAENRLGCVSMVVLPVSVWETLYGGRPGSNGMCRVGGAVGSGTGRG